jgi:hypothetical protein
MIAVAAVRLPLRITHLHHMSAAMLLLLAAMIAVAAVRLPLRITHLHHMSAAMLLLLAATSGDAAAAGRHERRRCSLTPPKLTPAETERQRRGAPPLRHPRTGCAIADAAPLLVDLVAAPGSTAAC